MLGLPWRLAFALIDSGWTLRNAVIWRKTNATPESVTDRFRSSYEHVFFFTPGPRYWFNLDALREEADPRSRLVHPNGRNPGDVWDIPTVAFPGAHFATMPPELAARCIRAGAKPGTAVLDPFHGAGTTGGAAARAGHPYVGVDLNPKYIDMSLRTRLAQRPLMDGAIA